jgi:hypothetical protein
VEKKTKVYIYTNQKSVLDPILGLGWYKKFWVGGFFQKKSFWGWCV